MVKKVKANKWKPLEINGAAFTNLQEGLIGIEECLDYDLNEIITGKKYISSEEEGSDEEESTETIIPENHDSKQKNKKKAGSKQKNNVKHENDSPSKAGSTNDTFVTENEDEDEDEVDMQAWNIIPVPTSILNALKIQKFEQPTEIQSLTLPAAILGKRDILGAAETGSGKTLAFGLPILSGILKLKESNNDDSASESEEINDDDNSNESEEESDFENDSEGIGCVKSINNVDFGNIKPKKPLYALILTPTRELAIQVKNHLIAAAKFTDIKVAVVVGGMASVKQERVLNKGPEIVVGTPGRLWELIQQGNEHLSQLDNIRYLAIDETDRMLEKGHFQELHHILERLNMDDKKRKLRQNFVFSATLTLIHELPKHIITKGKLRIKKKVADMTPAQKLKKLIDILGISDPKVVDITKGKGMSSTLTECRITCSIDEKDFYVYYFLQRHPGRTLIFCNSIGCVKRLTTLLGLLACNPLPLHASMQQRQRLKNLDRFKERANSILIATDVAARGLDISAVEHVLHYQTPRTSESYVHRSGRTARASNEGITVLLVEPSELQNYLRLCRTLGKSEDIPLFPVQDNYLNAVKQRVNLARELDKLDLQVKKTNSEAGWFQKAAEEMDIIIDDVSLKYDSKEAQLCKKAADVKRKQLTLLIQKPVFPKGFSGKYPLSSSLSDLMSIQGEVKPERAIDVMKGAIEDKSTKEQRSKPKVLFKPRIKSTDEKIHVKELMRENNKRKKQDNKNRSNKKRKFRK